MIKHLPSYLYYVYLKSCRVPTVMENPGKSWKKKWSWKVMENSQDSECHGNLFARKKSHGKVMEISCPNLPNRVPIVL